MIGVSESQEGLPAGAVGSASPAAAGGASPAAGPVMSAIEAASADAFGPDADLVKAARRGDLGAFEKLVKRYQRKVTSVANRLLNNMDDAMEIGQDAFIHAYEKLATLSEPKRFGPWLLRIVSNLALNRRRARRLRRAGSLDIATGDDGDGPAMDVQDQHSDDPSDSASAKDVQRMLSAAIAELPEVQRQALLLFSVEQMPQKDVAAILGCSVEAVKWHVFTARKKLKETMKDYL